MRQPLIDFLDRLQYVSTTEDLESLISRWALELGFQRAVFANFKADSDTPRLFIGSYPDSWIERYLEVNYIAVDPVARISANGVVPFKWGHKDQRQRFNPIQSQLFNEADDFGLSRGFAVPVHGPGGELSVLSVATDELDSGFHKLVDLSEDVLHLGCCYIHQHLETILENEEPELAPVKLSGREAECLLWTSSGRTASQVGDILKIADSTVIYHLENAKKKLGVRTKSHAVAKALAMGLLPRA